MYEFINSNKLIFLTCKKEFRRLYIFMLIVQSLNATVMLLVKSLIRFVLTDGDQVIYFFEGF